jgi:DNA repair ATPase RecN
MGSKMKITKRQLRRIIKEGKQKLLSEQEHAWEYSDDDELRELGQAIDNFMYDAEEVSRLVNEMGMRYGEMAALGTHARMTQQSVQELAKKFDASLDDLSKSHERGWYKQ